MEFHSAYNPPPRKVVDFTGEESKVQQSAKDETDINKILAKYTKTGLLNHVNEHRGEYGDFPTAPEYHEALNQAIRAEGMFMELPSAIRARFDNSPGAFLAFVQDPANKAEMVRLGLAAAPTIPEGEAPPPATPDPTSGGEDTSPAAA